MNRPQLQQLAEERVLEAAALLQSGNWSGAYYLVGYAIEFGLKSCVLAFVQSSGIIFRDKKFSEKCWTHNIEELVKLANLESQRGHDVAASVDLGKNWQIVKDWTEGARYESWTEIQARELFEAVINPTNGVFPWIKVRW